MAKVGLSFGRCLLDIVEGQVDIDDVLVVIARTLFDPNEDEEWKDIWRGYSGSEWPYNTSDLENEQRFRNAAIALWKQGKLHQPRKFGANPVRRPEYWLETVLPSEELDRNPTAKKAWDNFQTIAGLTNVRLDRDYR